MGNGPITLAEVNIASIKNGIPIPTKSPQQIIYDDPASSKFLFVPTAHGVAQGEIFLNMLYFIFPSVNVGITDFLSLSMGLNISKQNPTESRTYVNVDIHGEIVEGISASFGIDAFPGKGISTLSPSHYWVLSFTGGMFSFSFGMPSHQKIEPTGESKTLTFFGMGYRLSGRFKLFFERWAYLEEEKREL